MSDCDSHHDNSPAFRTLSPGCRRTATPANALARPGAGKRLTTHQTGPFLRLVVLFVMSDFAHTGHMENICGESMARWCRTWGRCRGQNYCGHVVRIIHTRSDGRLKGCRRPFKQCVTSAAEPAPRQVQGSTAESVKRERGINRGISQGSTSALPTVIAFSLAALRASLCIVPGRRIAAKYAVRNT